MDLDFQSVDRHPILEVAVEPVGLLDQNRSDARMGSDVAKHFLESGTTGALRGLHVNMFRGNRYAVLSRILSHQLLLCRIENPSFSCSLVDTRAYMTALLRS
jgi:hypothetical protein